MLSLRGKNPRFLDALSRYLSLLREEFGSRLVALYVARHPAIEVEGYNSLVVLREVVPEDQERVLRIAVEACRDLDPEDQIAPLVVEESEVGKYAGEFRKKI